MAEGNQELVKQFVGLATGNLSDAMGKKGNMHSSIKPVYPSAKLVGTAVTITCHPADNLTIHKAMEIAPAGSVLVVAAGGYSEAGLLGAIMGYACKLKGIAGAVIDGGVRAVEELEEINFPVFSRGVNPGGTVKETLGSINVPIQCGGILVSPGDIVAGDRDGVVVVPEARACEVLEKCKAIFDKEIKVRELLKSGKSTMEIYALNTLLDKKALK